MSERVRAGIGAAILTTAIAVGFAAPAYADGPLPPNCTAADLGGISAGVSAAMSVYLFTHPDVNAFFTGIGDQPIETVRAQLRDYLAEHPQTRDELTAVRQPLTDFYERCGGIAAGSTDMS